MSNKIRILIADDHKLFREGIASMLKNTDEFQIYASVSTGHEAIDYLKEHTVDIIILDIEMPGMDGLKVIQHLRRNGDETKILALSMHKSAEFVKNVFRSGGNGYLTKDAGQSKLFQAIKTIDEVGEYYDEEIAKSIFKSVVSRKRSSDISARELQVVKLIADELTTNQIAKKLNLSKHTIESHRQNVMLKIGVKNTAGLIRYAIEKGLI